jgi:lipopolysaccharide export system protein LptA
MIGFSAGLLFPEVSEEREDLLLEHAGRMHRRIEDERVVLYLFEDVVWRKGETLISSDRASYIEDDGWLRLTGNVTVTEPERTIYSDTVDYYEENDEAIATGDVKVYSDNNEKELLTNRLIYRKKTDHITALNRPIITVRREEEEEDGTSFVIVGDRVVSCGEDSMFIIGDVTVDGDSLSARCDSVFYDMEDDWIRLRKDPVVNVSGYTSWGEEVDIHAPEEELEQAMIRGNAEAHGKKELKEDEKITGEERYWSSADSLLLSFEEEELRRLSAFSRAKSLVEREDDEGEIEKNYVIGNTIVVELEEGKVEKVVVEGAGRGIYVMPSDNEGTGARSVRE